MTKKVSKKLQRALDEILAPGEDPRAINLGALKRGDGAKRMAKDVGVSLGMSLVTSAFGFSVMRNTTPPIVWVVVTEGRFLMLARPDGSNSCGELVFDAPVDALSINGQFGVFGELQIDEADSGANLARLSFGLRKDAHARSSPLLIAEPSPFARPDPVPVGMSRVG